MRESYRRPTDGKKEEQTHWPKKDGEGQRKKEKEKESDVYFRFQESSRIPGATIFNLPKVTFPTFLKRTSIMLSETQVVGSYGRNKRKSTSDVLEKK